MTGGGKLTVISGFQSQTVGAADGVVVRLAPASGEVITMTGRAPEERKPLVKVVPSGFDVSIARTRAARSSSQAAPRAGIRTASAAR